MKVRKSIWAVFALSLFCASVVFVPRVHSFFADAIQFLGTIQWTNGGAASVVQSVDNKGQMTFNSAGTALHFIIDQGTTPTSTANSTVNTGSSDLTGSVSITGGATASSTVTFNTGFTNPPFCVASDSNTVNAVAVFSTTSTVVFTLSGNRNDTISWMCLGR